MIKEDLEDEISNGVKSEGETQAKFEEQLGEANTLLEELKAKKTNLEQAISDTNTEIDENEVKKDYLASIKPDCDWILNSFTERRTKRAAEMQGLLQAKGMLAGASPAMTQNSVEFDDDEFPKMRFGGMSFLQQH